MTHLSTDPGPEGTPPLGGDAVRSQRVPRFDRTERALHWTTALLVLTLAATGAVLYIPSLSVAVGRRLFIEDTHVYVGIALFVPILVAVVGRWGANLRADLADMSGFTGNEVAWLKSLGHRGKKSIGKFNPGQKLNTNAIGGLLVVLFATGLILRWGNFLPVSVRTGATFVHDVFAVVLVVVVIGHVGFALTHPQALRSMVTGWVSERWARRHAPAWRVPRPPAQKAPRSHL
jgi:formate dehydrogenase subunit gamma